MYTELEQKHCIRTFRYASAHTECSHFTDNSLLLRLDTTEGVASLATTKATGCYPPWTVQDGLPLAGPVCRQVVCSSLSCAWAAQSSWQVSEKFFSASCKEKFSCLKTKLSKLKKSIQKIYFKIKFDLFQFAKELPNLSRKLAEIDRKHKNKSSRNPEVF